jgi:hypothetical protein
MSPHIAKETIRALCGVSGKLMGRIELLGRVSWPPRSPDFCGENSKSVVYTNNPYDLEALKQNICETIYYI